MSVTSSLKSQVDLPVWEWCRFAPVVSAAGLCTCSDESVGGRYIYYLSSATQFWRYDTISDGWQQLAAPTTTAIAISAMRYTVFGGYRGNVLSAGATSVVIPGLQGNKLVGKTIRITSGTGAGQERVISAITHEIVDHGMATTASALLLTDNQTIPKKWKMNQWQGYQVRVVFGVGQSQVRKVLYNDFNTLYFSTPNWQPYDSWNNTGFSAVPPYALPTNGTAHYYIEKSTATVPDWTTNPDSTSKFVVMSGGIWLAVGTTLALGDYQFHYYDVLSDTWFNKTKPSGVMTILATSDATIERTGEISGSFDSGDADASGTRTLVDATKTWVADRYANFQVRVTRTSTGVVQRRRILGNTANTLYVDKPWDETPDTTHTWEIYGDTNAIWFAGNGQSSLYKYMVEEDLWTPAQNYDSGVVHNLCYQKGDQLAFNATTVAFANGIATINTTPTAPGTGYKVGDVVNVTGTAGAKVRVTSVTPATGAVTGVELFCAGTAAGTVSAGQATTLFWPAAGGNNGLTIEVLTRQSTARATTTVPHNFVVGDVIHLHGSDVGAWNTNFTITAVDTTTTFEFVAPNTTAPVNTTNPNSATVITDPSKSWTVDEHKGKMVTLTIADIIPTAQARKILSNTATALTVATMTAQGVIGTSRYVIHDLNAFGKDDLYRIPAQDAEGWATAGDATTLTDSTKTWIPCQWAGYKLRVLCGTGFDKGEVAIASNTATILTLTTPGFTPDATTKYRIMDSYGLVTTGGSLTTFTDTTKNWPVNIWAGKSMRLNLATANCYYEVIITSNTANTITYPTTTTPLNSTDTCYTILAPAVRQIGIQAMWNYGRTNSTVAGKFLWVPRGGSTVTAGTNLIDRYDITMDEWDVTLLQNPQAEIEVLGSQWSYDGGDYIYWSTSGAQGTRVFRINMDTQTVEPAGQHPYANGVGLAGNRMEIITTVDGLKYLYLMRSTGSEWWRTLVFW
jgi:hypothetical protein